MGDAVHALEVDEPAGAVFGHRRAAEADDVLARARRSSSRAGSRPAPCAAPASEGRAPRAGRAARAEAATRAGPGRGVIPRRPARRSRVRVVLRARRLVERAAEVLGFLDRLGAGEAARGCRCRRRSRTAAIRAAGWPGSGIGSGWPWRGLPVAPSLTPSEPAAAEPASVVTSVELISRSSLRPRRRVEVDRGRQRGVVDRRLELDAVGGADQLARRRAASRLRPRRLCSPRCSCSCRRPRSSAGRARSPGTRCRGRPSPAGRCPASCSAVLPSDPLGVARRSGSPRPGTCGSCRAAARAPARGLVVSG